MDGKRFNKGKTRHDLTPAFAQEEYAKVLTMGAEKYGENNWRKGMAWSKVLGSLERHLQAIKRGEDFDEESGLLHSAHVMCNAAFLTEYYKSCPWGDDRYVSKKIRIGLDIDEVLCDFIGGFYEKFGIIGHRPSFWNDGAIKEQFSEIQYDEQFWTNLQPLISPGELTFEPTCYITSRSIDSSVTHDWIVRNGFPDVPVFTVGPNGSKSGIAKQQGLHLFVDDKYDNYLEMNSNGVCCFLMNAKHNEKYDVGFKRIYKLSNLEF